MPADAPVYLDPDAPTATRVADLLDRTTLREKLGQLVGTVRSDVADVEAAVREYAIGAASPFGHSASPYDTPIEAARVANRLQRYASENTRLGIPLLFFVDAVHGHARIEGSTVFPHNLGLAATRDPSLPERVGRVTAIEVSATGAHQSNDPVCDVARDPRWGRTFETFGESPFLCAEMAAAKVRGYRTAPTDPGVVPTAKHFPAYSQPARGQDAAPVDVSGATLERVFLPPFRAALDAGVPAVMPSYSAVNAEPVHGSRRYLTGLLREELGFDGYVVSDWGGVAMLHDDHRTAATPGDACRQAFAAGVDLASAGGGDYLEALERFVESGDVDESTVDRRARNVLAAKVDLGLFEDPFVDAGRAGESLVVPERRELAREAARESITLLKNDGTLPLSSSPDEVLVAGPNADDLANQLGGWSTPDYPAAEAVTVREGIERAVDDRTTVRYAEGAGIVDGGDVDAAADRAASADAAVVVLGEPAYIHEFSLQSRAARELHESDGDGDRLPFPSRTSLELPEAQRRLVRAVSETGTPVVVVLVTGRPLVIDWIAEHVPAVLMAYYPGMEGGTAVADVLFGAHNPSGKLPISIPRKRGNVPDRFEYLPHPTTAGSEAQPGSYEPRYPFGHGLSYTSFEHAVALSTDVVAADEPLDATLRVTNTGDRAGVATVDLFLADVYAARLAPVRRHVGFARLSVAPGATAETTVTLSPATIAAVGDAPEPGSFELHVEDVVAAFEVEPA